LSFSSSSDGQSSEKTKNFIKSFLENVQDELKKNKELQESKQQLEERLRKLGESDVKKKFDKIEQETAASSVAIAHKLNEFSQYVNKAVAEFKASEKGQEAIKQLKVAAETLEQAAKTVGDTQVYKQVATTAKAVNKELDNLTDVRMYSRPEELQMRSAPTDSKVYEANTTTSDIDLHKDSRWYAGWKSFSENNSYLNKLMDWKNRYDESDNLAVRMMRGLTDRVQQALSSRNEVAEVLSEIAKIDPKFEKHEWLKTCEIKIVPNILEAFIRGDLAVLEDWCYERAYNVIANAIKENQKVGFSSADSQIIDISKMELVSGKMMEQGPVFVITFQVFMINVVKNQEGKVIEGDPNRPIRVHHVWVMCRDMEEPNPQIAWKLLELHMQKGSLSI